MRQGRGSELPRCSPVTRRGPRIDEFVPKKEIDELYLNSPYYLVPDGEVGQQAFAVIRETIREEGSAARSRSRFLCSLGSSSGSARASFSRAMAESG